MRVKGIRLTSGKTAMPTEVTSHPFFFPSSIAPE